MDDEKSKFIHINSSIPFWNWLSYLFCLFLICFITGIYLVLRGGRPYLDGLYAFVLSPLISFYVLDYILIRYLREDVPKLCELLDINYYIDSKRNIFFQAKSNLIFSSVDKYFIYISLLTIWYAGLGPRAVSNYDAWQFWLLAFLIIFYLIYISCYLALKFIFIFCIKNLDLNQPILKQNREKIFKLKSMFIIFLISLMFYIFMDCADFIAIKIAASNVKSN
ncbi:Uncharacterised protein [Neisseria zoodegmatis]|uniref:Integral membrane protein n=2 Tax=Neisseria zoodegmatis TaxID=326523 RepID=A0AB38DSA2_9NEIS|nr:hypothetical protein BWD10_00310 [Neisseria zoodegmatis]SNU80001.1 Uncharacterised protein [Neisseria zoodegmatis]